MRVWRFRGENGSAFFMAKFFLRTTQKKGTAILYFTRDNFKVTPNGLKVIVLQQTKTGNDVVVPILDERVMQICHKYNYLFPQVEARTINRYIKEVLRELSVSVPSLRELNRTQLSMAERQEENTYIEMTNRIGNGEKLHGDELK